MPAASAQPTIKRLKLSELSINRSYQRPLDEARVAKIANAFEPALCGVLEVSAGNNGSYSVFDGQHRLAALNQLGEASWFCRVHSVSAQQQAELFVRLQTERRPVHPIDRHKAAVFAKNPAALALNALVHDAGYTITANKVLGSLSCVSTLYLCHDRYGPKALKEALGVIDEAWTRNDYYARKAPMVGGMALLLAKYDNSEVDRRTLVEKLKSTEAVRVTRAAGTEMRLGARSTTERVLVARQLLDAYNVRRRHLTEEELAEGKKAHRISPSKLGRDA